MESSATWPESLPAPLISPSQRFKTRAQLVKMESQRVRKRRTALDSQEFLEVKWNFTQDEYAEFEEFFKTTLQNGALAFTITTNAPSPLEGYVREVQRVVCFLEAKYGFSRSDNLHSVNAVLVVFDTMETEVNDPPLPGVDEIPFKWFNGPVYHLVQYGDWTYVSGRFTKYGFPGDWEDAKGICRILRTGELDVTFRPGGVAGGGFGIKDGYFAPTQLQGALNGGVICGMSYAFLQEPLLYSPRSPVVSPLYDRMQLNGEMVPPVVKLNPDGSRDETWDTDYLIGGATLPCHMSFHVYEQGNKIWTSRQEDIVATSASLVDFGGVNYSSLQVRTLSGTFLRRVHRRIDLFGGDPQSTHQVFVDIINGPGLVVYWSGQRGNAVDTGGLLQTVADDPLLVQPLEWLLPDMLHNDNQHSIVVFDGNLEIREAPNWSPYSLAGQISGRHPTMVPTMITRGCFVGSIVGSQPVFDDPGEGTAEGKFGHSEAYVHKGCVHFQYNHVFGGHFNVGGGLPAGAISPFPGDAEGFAGVTEIGAGGCALAFYGDGGSGNFINLLYKPEPIEDPDLWDNITGTGGGEDLVFFNMPIDFQSTDVKFVMTANGPEGGISNELKFRVWSPKFRPFVSVTTHLWDLRGGGDPGDPTLHGFSPFYGAVVDYDGKENCRVLKAMHDGTRAAPAVGVSANLGVFMTGMMEKFKGVTITTTHGQLFKIKYDGSFMSGFIPPIFGPESFDLLENIDDGDPETHHNKIMFGTISSGGNVIYIGGKFTSLLIDEEEVQVGHICCLNINSGAVVS